MTVITGFHLKSFWVQIGYNDIVHVVPNAHPSRSNVFLMVRILARDKRGEKWSVEGEREFSDLDRLKHIWTARIHAEYHHVIHPETSSTINLSFALRLRPTV